MLLFLQLKPLRIHIFDAIYLTVSCSSSPDSLLISGISPSKTSLKYPGPSSISADPVTQAKGFFSTFYPVKNQTSESFWNI